MATTPNRLETHWGKVRTFIQSEWPLITDFDLDLIDCEYDRLILKIKEVHGGPAWIMQEGEIRTKLQTFLNSLEEI